MVESPYADNFWANMNLDLNQFPSDWVGFKNLYGEMNCFLNSSLQSIWYMQSFRIKLLNSISSVPDHDHSVASYLRAIFAQYSNNLLMGRPPVDISPLRGMLDAKFPLQFALNTQADSMEALDFLLKELHDFFSLTQTCNGERACIVHEEVGLSFTERQMSKGSIRSEAKWESFNYLTSLTALLDNARIYQMNNPDQLGLFAVAEKLPFFMKKEWENAVISVEGELRSKVMILNRIPNIFITSLVWETELQMPIQIAEVVSSIPFNLNLGEIFHSTPTTIHVLVGMIVFGMGHYVFCLRQENLWYIFDDQKYMRFPNWLSMCMELINLFYQPVGIIYERRDNPDPTQKTLMDYQNLALFAHNLQALNTGLINPQPSGVPNVGMNREGNAWNCKYCNHANGVNIIICGNCKEYKHTVGPVTRHTWICPICQKSEKTNIRICSNCKKLPPGFFCCFNCLAIYKTKCEDCNVQPRCIACSSMIAKPPYFCPKCRSNINSSFCHSCKLVVENCSPLCENCQTAWSCLSCSSLNKPIESNCSSCGLIKPEAIQRSKDNFACENCEREISEEQSKKCYRCLNTTPDWVCKPCKIIIFPHNYGCKNCYAKMKECKKCKKQFPSICAICPHHH